MKLDVNIKIECWHHGIDLQEIPNETGFHYIYQCKTDGCKTKIRIKK